MQNMLSQIDDIVERIKHVENSKSAVCEILRRLNDKIPVGPNEEIKDERLIIPIEKNDTKDFTVAGIDGGIVKESLHGLELLLLRAVAVSFTYIDGKLKNVDYFPSATPLPIPKTSFDSFSEFELSSWYNFERQIIEITTAIESVGKLKPNFLFIDGSVVPQYVTKPNNPILKEKYNELVDKYKELFSLANNELVIAGIVEDSRSVKFCDILLRRIITDEIPKELKAALEKTNDSNLVYSLLKKNERTFVFNYSKNPLVHPLLKEFEEKRNNFYSFYVKTADFDRPLKVDFICLEDQNFIADRISEILIKTSGHAGYGLPSVLIEADQRAKLSQTDLNLFYLDLLNKIGNVSTIFKLRREMRPF